MAEPPLLTGAAHVAVTVASPAVRSSEVGAVGTPKGITVAEFE